MTAKGFVDMFAILSLGAAAWTFAAVFRNRGIGTSLDRKPLVVIILTMVGLLVSLLVFALQRP